MPSCAYGVDLFNASRALSNMASNIREQGIYVPPGTYGGFDDHTGQKFNTQFKSPTGGAWNTFVTYTAECPQGSTGTSITVSMEADKIFSPYGVDDANRLALEAVTAEAESQLVCTPVGEDIQFVSGENLFFVSGEQAKFVS